MYEQAAKIPDLRSLDSFVHSISEGNRFSQAATTLENENNLEDAMFDAPDSESARVRSQIRHMKTDDIQRARVWRLSHAPN